MTGPEDLGAIIGQWFNSNMIGMIFKYIGYTALAALIILICVMVYFWVQFKYKIHYPVILYDSDGQSAKLIRWRKDRVRIKKTKGGVLRAHYLFRRKYGEPIREEDIMPGNHVWMLRINEDGTYTSLPPFVLNKTITGYEGEGDQKKEIVKNIPKRWEYLNNEERAWCVLELKDTYTANITDDAQKRMLTYMIIAIILCLVTTIIAVWIIAKMVGSPVEAVKELTPWLQQIGSSLAGGGPN